MSEYGLIDFGTESARKGKDIFWLMLARLRYFFFSICFFMFDSYNKKLLHGMVLAFFTYLGLILSPSVLAAEPELVIRDQTFEASYVSQSISDPIVMEAGQKKTVAFSFKNTGTASWDGASRNFISAYTVEPKYRISEFKGEDWISGSQTAKMQGLVLPQKTGTLEIQLNAPLKTGDYVERFYLASENNTWVKNGYFFVKLKVAPATEKIIETTVPSQTKSEPKDHEQNNAQKDSSKDTGKDTGAETYKAHRFILSKKRVEARGGERVKLIIGFQNVGSAVWKRYSFVHTPISSLAVSRLISFADNDWQSASTVFMQENSIAPGETLRQEFYFRTPSEAGEYTAKFRLAIDDVEVLEGSEVEIPVSVTENAPFNYTEPVFGEEVIELEKPRLSEEPRVRVGIKAPDSALQFVSFDDDYLVYNGNDSAGEIPKKKIAILRYSGGLYSIKGADLNFETDQRIRLEPKNDPHAVFTLLNLDRPLSRVGPDTFNSYRGALEYQKGQNDGDMYAVNDLLLDDYAAGIAEVSKNDPEEFVKANIVAARTYAYISKNKYPFFDVLGSTYDQLYLGYRVEEFLPNVLEAAKTTRGRIVTYKGEAVTTPYFGNSNGRTRSWVQVWGGRDKPWLVPVTAQYDRGRRMYGHGVGMSQRDAALRAKNEGLSWTELLKYYYTGVDITWMYE